MHHPVAYRSQRVTVQRAACVVDNCCMIRSALP